MDRLVSEPASPSLLSGTIYATPASLTAKVFVTIDGAEWGPLPWVTRGELIPQKGDECLVAFDENRNGWVVCWDW